MERRRDLPAGLFAHDISGMILFFIRRFNDIDHLAPIVHKLKKETKKEIQVLCLNPVYDIENDVRLKFLRDSYEVIVKYVYEAYRPSTFFKILSSLAWIHRSCINNKRFTARLLTKFYRTCIYRFVCDKFFNAKYYTSQWAKGLFKEYRASILVFDFVKKRQYIANSLFVAAKELEIPTIAITPGTALWYERLGTVDTFDDYDLPGHDYLIMQHEIRKNLTIKIGGPPEKMHLLGAPRFCREWHEILLKIIPATISKESSQRGKLRVLYVDRPVDYNMDSGLLTEMINAIAELDFIHLLIKAHTRSSRLGCEKLRRRINHVSDIDSVELIRWADVVIGTTSSILLEVLLQDKILLYPKYIHEITTTFEKMKACWQVNSLDEVVSALAKIRANPGYRPYSNKCVENFITTIVYNGDSHLDVLGAYRDFIISKERSWN